MQYFISKAAKAKTMSFKSLLPNTTHSFKIVTVPQVLSKKPSATVLDGNSVASYVAYAFSENSFIYPISPSSSMGDNMDQYSSAGKKNMFGQTVHCIQMQSEGGACGAMHGAIAAGALTSTFTASQGLLLMIPNMYLMAGELAPTVIHVASRTISKHALSIFNDHSDIMSIRQIGFAILCSANCQEVHDMALVSHIATLRTSLPFLHFFDGWQTSHSYQNVELMDYAEMRKLFPEEDCQKNLRDKALSSINPISRGTGQRSDIFFQQTVAAKKFYDNAPDIIEDTMKKVSKLTGRPLSLFEYYGDPQAEDVIILMATGAQSSQEVVEYLNKKGRKTGILKVCLYRPWSEKHLLAVLPKSVKRVTVLDKTREDGGVGNPLYLDCLATITRNLSGIKVLSGCYGLASKSFTPDMIKAVFDNQLKDKPKEHFTVGINDDVYHSSLDVVPLEEPTLQSDFVQCINWGFGGDGSIGAMSSTTKIIAENAVKFVALNNVYDSKKEAGATVSHLRFGPSPITSEYPISQDADFISCSKETYASKYNMLKPLKKGGKFLLNTTLTSVEEFEKQYPPKFLRQIAKKNAKVFILDAQKVAREVGMPKRTNTVMQVAFFKLSGILPGDSALDLLINDLKYRYKKHGPKIVDQNLKAVEIAAARITELKYPSSWASLTDLPVVEDLSKPEFVRKIMDPVLTLQGDNLPVSAFTAGGLFPQNTSVYEKRGVANEIPKWIKENCTQCNYCSLTCPHSVIRPFLLTKDEKKNAPSGYETIKAKGGNEFNGYDYTIQISPNDCTGCAVCVETCPDKALEMVPFKTQKPKTEAGWDYSYSLPVKDQVTSAFTVKGSQFQRPYFEFSGACAGCGETAYMKLASQLFGKRMIISNASGCSSVWGGSCTTSPWVVDEKGRGPAWARSLFEDNAEYGFGMFKANEVRKEKLYSDIEWCVKHIQELPAKIKTDLQSWLDNWTSVPKCDVLYESLVPQLEELKKGQELFDKYQQLRDVYNNKKLLVVESNWLVGGDGWAYDIGFGGLDHVLAKNENLKILIMDTEMYSNTGGQMSKATQKATSIKFAISGKRESKKDLGLIAMSYGSVYVASVSLGANYNQCLQAFLEADAYPGTAIILAFAPCIDWGLGDMKKQPEVEKEAVESGYWNLYRYNPLKEQPLTLDSKKIRGDLVKYLAKQSRYERLFRTNKEIAEGLHNSLKAAALAKHETLLKNSMTDLELLEYLKKYYGEKFAGDGIAAPLILFGSETGNAEQLAKSYQEELAVRGIKAKCMAMDDIDVDELEHIQTLYCFVSTCGQGELPSNCRHFVEELQQSTKKLDNLKFAVFGLGDSSYINYNQSAQIVFKQLLALGAQNVVPLGLGDDKAEEKYETEYYEWLPNVVSEMQLPPKPETVPEPKFALNITQGTTPKKYPTFLPSGTQLVPLKVNKLISPKTHNRDVRHYEFDIKGQKPMMYASGDCMAIYPHNNEEQVIKFLDSIKLNPNTQLKLSRNDGQNIGSDLPSEISIHQLFTEVLDVFGRPNRRFYEFLASTTKDPAEKKKLQHLLSKEGKPELLGLIKETVNYADLISMFPSSLPSLEYMIQFINPIKPRLYSIASHPDFVGENLHLCIIADDWKTPKGVNKEGLCSNYLRRLDVSSGNTRVVSKLYPSSITLAETQQPPIFMIALGTGIAPMRALVQERFAARQNGEKVGPMTLLFGARNQKLDYLYEEEWDHYQKEGILEKALTAFSRDQEKKIYVQHRLQENKDLVFDYLYKRKGYFYLCGLKGPEVAVRKTIRQTFKDGANLTDAQADEYMLQFAKEGRFNFETW